MFEEDEQKYADNFNDWERVGIGGVFHPLLMNTKLSALKDGTGNIAKMQERFFKIYASDEEKFAHILEAVYYNYNEMVQPEMESQDLVNMLDAANGLIPNIYFKNPTCYFFGYFIVDAGAKKISRNRLKQIQDLKGLDISGVDLVRYCRLWINYYKENGD